jgi:transcriptional regulator with XRE-family HTH domain
MVCIWRLRDNILSISIKTPRDVQLELASRFKTCRLAMNLTQEGLATRSGVSLGSLKRFERAGLIALDSLLKIAHVLNCLEDFDKLCADDGHAFAMKSLDEILAAPKTRRKGRIK